MLTPQDIEHIATLARIHLQEDEAKHLAQNLENILLYVNKLQELDVSKVVPTSHAIPMKNVYREDVIKPSLSQADALKTAVAQHSGSFKVPQVIE